MTKSAFFSLEYPGLIHGRYKYVLKVILNIIKRWPISLRTYVHRPTTNPLPYTTLFIQNISPFLIGLLSRKKTIKILNCDQSQQTKLAARKQATKLLPLLNAALSFPLLIGFFLATQSHSRNIFVVYGFTSFTINPPQNLLFSLGSEIVWIDGTKCIAIRRKDVD